MPTLKSVDLRHDGGMRFEAEPSSGHPLEFDDRTSNQGGSPVETILAALGACTAMDVISIAGKKRQAIDDYRIHLRGDQRDEYPQVYTEIEVVHEITGVDISEAAIRRSIELSATKYCPVSAMLSMGETEIHHGYRIANTGADPFSADSEVIVTGPHWVPTLTA